LLDCRDLFFQFGTQSLLIKGGLPSKFDAAGTLRLFLLFLCRLTARAILFFLGAER
jgi:hypothetical protein